MTRYRNLAGVSKFAGFAVAAAIAFGLAGPAAAQQTLFGGFEPPAGWVPPPLDPTGVQLQTQELAPGVYALISSRPPVDNSGFIVGEKGVLVIDAHINGAMARQIQAAVRAVTDKPILLSGQHQLPWRSYLRELRLPGRDQDRGAPKDSRGHA